MGVNVFEFVFPLFAGPKSGDIKTVTGTAFSIGGDRFLTAGHCIRESEKQGWTGLGAGDGDTWKIFETGSIAVDDDLDLAIIEAKLPAHKSYGWQADIVEMNDSVHSVGFAHGYDPERKALGFRAFAGTVVGTTKFRRLLKKTPGIYELSFACPRGLSGAPLYLPGAQPTICGYVIGNESMEMEVYRDKEVVDDATYIRFEALQLGIAIRTAEVLGVTSDLLGGTLEEHLKKHKLLS